MACLLLVLQHDWTTYLSSEVSTEYTKCGSTPGLANAAETPLSGARARVSAN